jgi:fatty-acyl-CoA synthase
MLLRPVTLEQRLTEHSIYDVFAASAARHAEHTAVTMLMTGAPDEQPRCVSYPSFWPGAARG